MCVCSIMLVQALSAMDTAFYGDLVKNLSANAQ